MVKFERYPHVNDLIDHYISLDKTNSIAGILERGIASKDEAELFSRFIWKMVESVNEDEENEIVVLGSSDNTEMLPDVSYEVTKLMKAIGYYSVWESVSKEEMG